MMVEIPLVALIAFSLFWIQTLLVSYNSGYLSAIKWVADSIQKHESQDDSECEEEKETEQ